MCDGLYGADGYRKNVWCWHVIIWRKSSLRKSTVRVDVSQEETKGQDWETSLLWVSADVHPNESDDDVMWGKPSRNELDTATGLQESKSTDKNQPDIEHPDVTLTRWNDLSYTLLYSSTSPPATSTDTSPERFLLTISRCGIPPILPRMQPSGCRRLASLDGQQTGVTISSLKTTATLFSLSSTKDTLKLLTTKLLP